jgi:hypothetical protein
VAPGAAPLVGRAAPCGRRGRGAGPRAEAALSAARSHGDLEGNATGAGLPGRAPVRPTRLSAERVLLGLGLLFGLALVAVQPPVQTPDESHHLWRAYQVAEGRLAAERRGESDRTDAPLAHGTGGRLPAGLHAPNVYFGHVAERGISPSGALAALRLQADPADRVFLGFSNTALHPPLAYAPQASAIAAAKRLTPSVLAYYYAGRVANLLTALALVWAAVRIAPVGKWAFVVVALTPMTLSLLASLNADAFALASCFVFVALVLRAALGAAPGPALLAALVAAAAAIALSKPLYLTLLPLLAIVPVRRFGGSRRLVAFAVVLAAVVGACWAGWGAVLRGNYSPADGTDPTAILDHLGRHPVELPVRIVRTIVENGLVDAREFLGALGLQSIWLPWLLLGPHAAMLLVIAVLDPESPRGLAPWQRALVAGVWVLAALAIFVAATILWGRPEERIVDVQGRYFLPIAPVLLLALHWPAAPGRRRWVPRLATAWLALLLGATVAVVGARSWGTAPRGRAAEEQVNLAQAFLWSGQGDEARRRLEAALRRSPNHARARDLLARLSLVEGDFDAAILHLRWLHARPGAGADPDLRELLALAEAGAAADAGAAHVPAPAALRALVPAALDPDHEP